VPGGLAGWIIWPKPEPIAALEDTVEAKERVDASGAVVTPLDEDDLDAKLERLRDTSRADTAMVTTTPASGERQPSPGGDLQRNYRSGGFNTSLAWGHSPALLLIDFVLAYFKPGAALYMGNRGCLDAAARVLHHARHAGIPVVHTRIVYDDNGLDGGLFVQKLPLLRQMTAGAPLGETMPEVAPQPHDVVVTKQYASAFFGTSLAATLTALRVDTVIITGVSTSGCVRASALDALQHGFVPLVVRDAVGDRHPQPHEANLFDLQAKYAEVVSEQAVVDWLARLAADSEAKT